MTFYGELEKDIICLIRGPSTLFCTYSSFYFIYFIFISKMQLKLLTKPNQNKSLYQDDKENKNLFEREWEEAIT